MDHHVNVELLNLSQEQKNMGLIDAAKSNDIISVKHFIEEGANLNAVDARYNTALHWAARNGNNKITAYLLQNGANINQKNKRGNSPLHISVAERHVEIVASFLQKGVDTNLGNNKGDTALHIAIKEADTQMVALLVPKSKMNLQNKSGDTPLHFAAMKGQTEMVRLLLNCGAKINTQNKEGKAALRLAVDNRHVETTTYLLKNGADVNQLAEDDSTALHVAAADLHLELTLLLLQAGADPYIVNEYGETSLSFAFWNNKPDKSNLLFCFLSFMSDKEIKENTRKIYGFKEGLADFKKQLLVCQQKLNNLFINFSAAQIPESIEDEIAKTFPVWYGPHIQKHLKELQNCKLLKELEERNSALFKQLPTASLEKRAQIVQVLGCQYTYENCLKELGFVDANSVFHFNSMTVMFDAFDTLLHGKHYTPSFLKPIQIEDKEIDIGVFNKIRLNESVLKNR